MSEAYDDDEDGAPTAPFWMSTFSDMATLLLTFFVLIVSMSEVQVKKFKEALSYFQGGTGVFTQPSVVSPAGSISPPGQSPEKEEAERFEELGAYLKEQGLEHKIQLNLTERGVHLVITDSVMFRSGEAVLKEPAQDILARISGIIGDRVQSVVVEGHTDNVPIQTSVFPSNWELSASRAATVVRFFLEQKTSLPPDHLVATGYGEYHPIASNTTPEGRAKNRRVEVLFSWKPWQNSPIPQPI